MITPIDDAAAAEYQAELEQLADEKKLVDETAKECAKRDREIKDRIIEIADVLQGSGKRMVFQMKELGLQWDRRINRTGGGLSLDGLESMIGKSKFKKLVLERRVSWEVSEEKFQAAREAGEITDQQILTCTIAKKIGSAVWLSKFKKVENEDEYNDPEDE